MTPPLVVFNGATGGLGRHLAKAITDLGATSCALTARLGDERGTIEELSALPVDIRGHAVLIQSAGMVPVRACESDPDAAFDVNVDKTVRTAEAFARAMQRRGASAAIVFVSSGHVYAQPRHRERLDENAPLGPRSVYAESKLRGEEALASVMADHDGRFTAARVFGLLGPHQRAEYLLPGLIRRAKTGAWDGIPGLHHVRDYLDARDAAAHLAYLAVHVGSGGRVPALVNVCSGEPTSVLDVLVHVMTSLGTDPESVSPSPAPGRPSDVPWVVGDPSLLRSITQRPLRSIPLERTVADAINAE